jgi:hypothetical protein
MNNKLHHKQQQHPHSHQPPQKPQRKLNWMDDIKYQHYHGKYKNQKAIESQDEFNTEQVSPFSFNDPSTPPHSQPTPENKITLAINSIKI